MTTTMVNMGDQSLTGRFSEECSSDENTLFSKLGESVTRLLLGGAKPNEYLGRFVEKHKGEEIVGFLLPEDATNQQAGGLVLGLKHGNARNDFIVSEVEDKRYVFVLQEHEDVAVEAMEEAFSPDFIAHCVQRKMGKSPKTYFILSNKEIATVGSKPESFHPLGDYHNHLSKFIKAHSKDSKKPSSEDSKKPFSEDSKKPFDERYPPYIHNGYLVKDGSVKQRVGGGNLETLKPEMVDEMFSGAARVYETYVGPYSGNKEDNKRKNEILRSLKQLSSLSGMPKPYYLLGGKGRNSQFGLSRYVFVQTNEGIKATDFRYSAKMLEAMGFIPNVEVNLDDNWTLAEICSRFSSPTDIPHGEFEKEMRKRHETCMTAMKARKEEKKEEGSRRIQDAVTALRTGVPVKNKFAALCVKDENPDDEFPSINTKKCKPVINGAWGKGKPTMKKKPKELNLEEESQSKELPPLGKAHISKKSKLYRRKERIQLEPMDDSKGEVEEFPPPVREAWIEKDV